MPAPKVLLPDVRATRPVDIPTCLLRQRVVFLGEAITSPVANNLVQQLLYLQMQDPKAPITLYINSPGGSVIDGMAIYDHIRRSSCPVHAVVSGMAASMASVILSGCCKGERTMLAHSEVLLHQPSIGFIQGPASDIEIGARQILRSKELLLRLLATNCNQTYEKLLEDCDRDHWLDARESVAYGIADRVLE